MCFEVSGRALSKRDGWSELNRRVDETFGG